MLGEPEANDQQLGGLFGGPAASTSQADKPAVEKLYKDIESTEHDYIKVDELAEMKKLAADLLNQKIICFDTETTSINANDAELVGIAFAYEKGKAYSGIQLFSISFFQWFYYSLDPFIATIVHISG